MGQRASDTRGITFEDAVVPAEVESRSCVQFIYPPNYVRAWVGLGQVVHDREEVWSRDSGPWSMVSWRFRPGGP